MFPVVAGTTEYQEAIKEFQDTIKLQHTIVEVKRIQNRNEYSKYIAFREAVSRKHGPPVNTRRLFHGSKQESLELIAFQGFNRNFAAAANGKWLLKILRYDRYCRLSIKFNVPGTDPELSV